MRTRVAVLISGRGSNLAALIAAAADPAYPAEIALVVSDRPDAGGLVHAENAGIATAVVQRRDFPTKTAFDAAITGAVEAAAIDLICLAGFMRVLSDEFVAHWRDRLINIHPSLLPAFPGLDTHTRALAAGVRVHGCTVHFVRAAVDSGPIIAQAAVPVLSDDSEETLAARVLASEHRLYPMALALVAGGRATVAGERVILDAAEGEAPPLVSPQLR